MHRLRRRRQARSRRRSRRPRSERVRARCAALAPQRVRLYNDDDFDAHPELPKGYIGPDFEGASVVVADPAITVPVGWVTGANERDHHVRNAVLGRDFTVDVWADLVTIVDRRHVPALRPAVVGRPWHRGGPRLPDRHEVLGRARRELHRRERRATPDGHGLLRHRRVARRRRGRGGASRRARHRVAVGDRARTTCTSWPFPAAASRPPTCSSRPSGSTGS